MKATFSSNLVYIPPSRTESSVVVLSVRSAMGVYVALSLLLTGLTITASYMWNRRSNKVTRPS